MNTSTQTAVNQTSDHSNQIAPSRKPSVLKRWLLVAPFLLMAAASQPARASLCIVPPENGNWHNVNPNTRAITRVNFRMTCTTRFVTTCHGFICTGHWESTPNYYLRVFGACHPTDCNWGEVKGTKLTSGSLAGWYYFKFDQGFAKRYVYAKSYAGGWLRVWIRHDFVDPHRADYTTDEWFRH